MQLNDVAPQKWEERRRPLGRLRRRLRSGRRQTTRDSIGLDEWSQVVRSGGAQPGQQQRRPGGGGDTRRAEAPLNGSRAIVSGDPIGALRGAAAQAAALLIGERRANILGAANILSQIGATSCSFRMQRRQQQPIDGQSIWVGRPVWRAALPLRVCTAREINQATGCDESQRAQ